MADLIERDLTIHELEAFRESCIANLVRMSFDDITDVVKDIPAVNRWISVEDALPEYGEYVLFIRKNCEVYVGYYDEKSTWNTDYQWFIGEDVTHWMPLPEPPEKE